MITREEIRKALSGEGYSEEEMQRLKIEVILDLRDEVAELKQAINSLSDAIKKMEVTK